MSVDRNECGLSEVAWEGLQLIWCWIYQTLYIDESVSSSRMPCLSCAPTSVARSVGPLRGKGVRMKIESLTLKIICNIFASRDVTCTCADLAYIETKSSPELTC